MSLLDLPEDELQLPGVGVGGGGGGGARTAVRHWPEQATFQALVLQYSDCQKTFIVDCML